MDESFAVIKIRLKARVGDDLFDDVIQYTSGFALNSIPMASLLVACGRNVRNDKLATIHDAVGRLKIMLPVKIYMQSEELDMVNAQSGVKRSGTTLLFEGKAVGTGWQRNEGSAFFTIHVLHWLSELNHASAVSASSHPGNPCDWTYPGLYRAMGLGSATSAGGGNLGEPTWVPMINKDSVTPASLSDIWGNVLHPWMTAVAQDDPADFRLLGGQPGGADENTLNVLKRIGPNPEGTALNLELAGADADIIATSICQALQEESGNSWVNTTLWGKIVGDWSPAYWFAIVPRITDALIVPFTGGLQGAPWAVIGDEDYAQCELNAQLHQVLRAVGIVHPVKYACGANLNHGHIVADRTGLAGWYQPPNLNTGMVLLKDAPRWLSDPLIEHAFSRDAQAVNGGVVGNALDAKGVGKPQTPARNLPDAQQNTKAIIDNYAHQWYVLEMLKGRTGEIGGKLRFDIAPGSNVMVEAGSARNIPRADDKLAMDAYATVVRVSYVINAESQRAGTAFSLAHIRTAQENNDDTTSVDKPPLYQQAWRGAVLSKGYTAEQVF